ncbi:PIF1 helicase, putative [Medicago truncatula]|uniref:PIF1 helicase, putative n=1 Tax=Medicago truncatula TaxID=3880 RepID=G7J6D7_MEDTR|nr:PIF1 helicase, putative [Medicago truncatula]
MKGKESRRVYKVVPPRLDAVPIMVCFAMTINKRQCQSLKQVGIYLPQSIFSHGQLYVAI